MAKNLKLSSLQLISLALFLPAVIYITLRETSFVTRASTPVSTCVQQCPGTDNILRSCTPPDADGTSADSACNQAGRTEVCNYTRYCCAQPDTPWTKNVSLCSSQTEIPPVIYYKFDDCSGTVLGDSSPNNYIADLKVGLLGTVIKSGSCTDPATSSTTWAKGYLGKFGSSVYLDGKDDYISVPNNTSLNPKQLTLSAWIKLDNITQTRISGIVTKGDQNYRVAIGSGTSLIIRLIKVNVGDIAKSTIAIKDKNWHHIAVSYDENVAKIYIDGIDRSGPTTKRTFSSAPTNLFIGAFISTLNKPINHFPGQIDELRLYDYALTSSQILKLYSSNSL